MSDLSKEKPDLKGKLHEVPHKPGVYLMRDRFNTVIYVGKARDLRKRLSTYFTPSKKTLGDPKTRALINSIWEFDYHTVRNEPESLLLEGKLIKEFRPKYNVAFRDDKRFLLVKVHLSDPFPRFQMVRARKEDGSRYFGPFAHSGALRNTIDWINKEFGLRNCRPLEPGEQDYKHCNADVIKNCTAPCIGKIDSAEYRARVEKACEFLKGHAKDHLKKLEQDMFKAAEKLQFEKAAQLRDILDHLRKTLKPTRTFTRRQGLVGSQQRDPLKDVEELQQVLHLDTAPVLMECFDISNISTTHIVASMVRFKNGKPDNSNYRRYRIKTVEGQDDFASMAEVVRRRYARILLGAKESKPEETEASQESTLDTLRRLGKESEEEQESGKKGTFVRIPDLVIVDGGKGQLSVAYEQLKQLGLHDLPLIGLAKQREEIFRPGISDPILLPHDNGALQLLQRIRDEAHRFANGYHQILMKQRVEESILDDCPGVSKRRKTTLLKKFGSLARLRKASVADLTALPGVSETLAEEIVRFLKTH